MLLKSLQLFQQCSNSDKSVILFKVTVHFILSPVANFNGYASQRVREDVSKHD